VRQSPRSTKSAIEKKERPAPKPHINQDIGRKFGHLYGLLS
jgi:hypothetical protein